MGVVVRVVGAMVGMVRRRVDVARWVVVGRVLMRMSHWLHRRQLRQAATEGIRVGAGLGFGAGADQG